MHIRSKHNVPLLCAASVIAISGAARAQEAAPSETIVVTGSRVISDVANSPTPVTSVSTVKMQATTPTDVPDALNKLPIFVGSSTPNDANNASNSSIGNVLNLRNFGAQRTLILFDSHRQPPSNANGTVDIDTLPEMLMSRVDIVTGGASAVYGSDAVTGVVNFILDKHFTGVKINANAGISEYTDAAEQQIGIAAGTELLGGRAHFEGSLRYYHSDPVLYAARIWGTPTSWVSEGLGTKASPFLNIKNGRLTNFSNGGKITCTGCAANGQQFVSNGVLGPFIYGTPTPSSSVYSGGDGTVNETSTMQESQLTYQDFERFSYNINDTTTFYIQVVAAQSYNTANHTTNYIQTGASPNQFYANNPFLTPLAQSQLASPSGVFTDPQYLSYPDHPGFVNQTRNRNLGVSMGLDGTMFGKYDWDLYYSHAENRLSVRDPSNESNQLMYAANDAVRNSSGTIVCYVSTTQYASLYPGCIPMNRFGPTALSDNQFRYFLFNSFAVSTQRLDDFSGSVSGEVFDLPAGPVKAALNGEFRRLSYGVVSNALPGTVDCTGLRLCNSSAPDYENTTTNSQATKSENVFEFAGEVNVPLLKDVPLIQSLSMDLAGRYTDYSISGSVETWKIGLDYHVNDDLHFRATTSVDIRAPTLFDLYAPATLSHNGFADIHTGNQVQQVNVSAQGNANLVPEVSRTYTAGVVLTPTFIPGLTVSVDYYQMVLKNAITSLSGETSGIPQICEASNGTSPFCALFIRPFPFSNATAANYPTTIISGPINAALNDTGGVDVELDYGFAMSDIDETLPGTVELRMLADNQPWNDVSSFQNAPISVAVMPKGRVTTFVTYSLGNWTFDLDDRFLTKYPRSAQPGLVFFLEPYNKSLNYIDINFDRKFKVDDNTLDAYFNIKNVIDTAPPVEPTNQTVPGASPYGAYIPGVDAIGRYFTIGVRARL